ncbi:MAG: prepilin-type N-terminal cleavage/methylation domain-containing protein [bacterium]
MKMKLSRKNKAGFTLVELMVVAIIVAILAAVAIPLMTGNKKKAMATEAQAALGSIRTAMQVYKAENGNFPTANAGTHPYAIANFTIKTNDLAGKYFADGDYTVQSAAATYTATATGSTGDVNGLTVTLTEAGAWGGTLLQ